MPVTDGNLPAGLRLLEAAISPRQERDLIALIEAGPLDYPPYDPGNRRSSTSYGWKYDYAADSFHPCPPLPEGLYAARAIAAGMAGVQPEDLTECLLNRYEPGAVIQPHRDKPVWEHVIGLSLGAEVRMRFDRADARPDDRFDVLLRPRSAYLLAGDARYLYRHSLPAIAVTRWSISFRTFSSEGRALFRSSVAA